MYTFRKKRMEKIELEDLKGYWKSEQTISNSGIEVDLYIKTKETHDYVFTSVVRFENKTTETTREAPVEIISHPELEKEFVLKIGNYVNHIKAYTGEGMNLDWQDRDLSFRRIDFLSLETQGEILNGKIVIE